MRKWPRHRTTECLGCGVTIELERRGDGRKWRRSRNYWYTPVEPHECDELTEMRERIKVQTATIEGALFLREEKNDAK